MTTESATVQVMHIGTRERRADTMSGEGTVWHGQGDVKTVSRKAWENHLRKYPDLWVLAPEAAAAPAAPASVGLEAAGGAKPEGQGEGEGGADDKAKAGADGGGAPDGADSQPYATRERADLIKEARERGLQFDGRASKEQVIELLLADDKAKAGA